MSHLCPNSISKVEMCQNGLVGPGAMDCSWQGHYRPWSSWSLIINVHMTELTVKID